MGGLAVVAVNDGYSALSYLEPGTPSAVVLDMGLPRVSGFDVQHELAAHAATADIPIVVVTGSDTTLNTAAYECVLRKPIDVADLVAAVRRCLSDKRKK
jgi:DNA-binding response OmpR family regulator